MAAADFQPLRSIIYQITSGKDVNKLSCHPTEAEILLSPKHQFVVCKPPYQKEARYGGSFTVVELAEKSDQSPWLS